MNVQKIIQFSTGSKPIKNAVKKAGEMMDNGTYDNCMSGLINKVKAAPHSKEAENILIKTSQTSQDLKNIDQVRFAHRNYNVHTFFKSYGDTYSDNLKKLNDLKLSIVPQHIEKIDKDINTFVVTKLPQSKEGELISFSEGGRDKISKLSKIEAFEDFKTLTKAGLVDDQVLNSDMCWFASSDNKVIIPSWMQLRLIRPEESEHQILQTYYNRLFK
jgi:hypothetical protein